MRRTSAGKTLHVERFAEKAPADDSFRAVQAVGYAPAELPVDLQGHPHGRFGPSQAQRSISFSVHDVDVGSSGQEQPGERMIRSQTKSPLVSTSRPF